MIASDDDSYLRIFVNIFSEGRQQGFSINHKVFPNWPKKIAIASNDDVYLRISVNIFTEGRRQAKMQYLPTSIYVWLNLPGAEPPQVSTPFLPGRRHSAGSEAPPEGSTPVKLIVDTL